jgi:AcrR family transcriptional regulator
MTHVDLVEDVPSKMGRKRDHTRDPEILDAALDVLAEEGYDGMTVEMVATRAKAGKATLYRRWPSKSDLVLDAVACMKSNSMSVDALPDTGTLRGDLIAIIKPPSMKDAEKKLRIMTGLASLLEREPGLSEAANRVIVEPRRAINRALFQRAIARGEMRPDVDIELLSLVSASMVSYRSLMLRKPVDKEFLVSVIDGIILPAAGIRPEA